MTFESFCDKCLGLNDAWDDLRTCYNIINKRELQIKKLGETVQYQKDIIRDRQRQIEDLNDELGNKVRMLHMSEQAEDEANKFALKAKEKIEQLEKELDKIEDRRKIAINTTWSFLDTRTKDRK